MIIDASLAYALFLCREASQAIPAVGVIVSTARDNPCQDVVDEKVVIIPVVTLARGVKVTDSQVVDGLVETTGWLIQWLGRIGSTVHTGASRRYATWTPTGTVAALCLVLVAGL